MPLAFSTLGCPGDSLAQVIATAHNAGATGLELRAAAGEFVYPQMDAAQRAALATELADAGLTVLALASYVRICAPTGTSGNGTSGEAGPSGEDGTFGEDGANDPVLAELLAAVDHAAELSAQNPGQGQCAQLRVFPGAGLEPTQRGVEPSPEMAAADLRGARRLNAAASHATACGVKILLETHDSHPRAADVCRILAHVDAAAPVGVIWDLMHPWRYDEAPEVTASLLTDWLAYAQFKDGVRQPGSHTVTLTLPGEGELPLAAMHALAQKIASDHGNSDPWISLEWERAWYPELPHVSTALASLKTALAEPENQNSK